MKTMNLKAIRIDGGTQQRAEIDQDTVNQYAEAIEAGAEFPPVAVVWDGTDAWLADGFHRWHAHNKLGKVSIAVHLANGTMRDAIWLSVSANANHGLRRSQADKRKAVQTLLDDFEWTELSDREIAKHCSVSHQLVAAVRAGGEQSSAVFNRPKQLKEAKLNNVVEGSLDEPENEPVEKDEAITEVLAENERLQDRLAVAAMDASDEERTMAEKTIADLREEVRVLKIDNEALRRSRDTFQAENAQLKKQVAAMTRQLKKAA